MADKNNDTPDDEDFDANVDLFSEYYEESLPADKQAELKALIAEDEKYKKAYADFEKTMELLSGMHKMSAPLDFDKKVEGTINRRSGGRFFGRKAFGDRIPYEILAIVVMVLAAFVYWMGRTSGTGGHRMQNSDEAPPQTGSEEVVPKL